MSDSSIRLQKLVTEQEFGFLAPVESKLQEVERQIAEMFPGDVPYVQEAGKHISQSGGKRLRPIVLLLCAKLCGYEGELDTAYACIVECIHTATLVHDDIIDKAEVRRGKASINSLFGDHITVLFGDYLYLKAMKRALDIGSLKS